MDTVERILREAIANSPDGKVNRQDFFNTASRQTRYVTLTPMEVDIVFHFAGMGDLNARLGLTDFGRLLDPMWERRTILESQLTDDLNDGNFLHGLGKSIYNFGLGGIAGACKLPPKPYLSNKYFPLIFYFSLLAVLFRHVT